MEPQRQRIVIPKTLQFSDREQLLSYLLEAAARWEGKLTVMAGHYMLLYRAASQKLAPLIASVVNNDPEASTKEQDNAKDIGDFPEATFEMGLHLATCRLAKETRIALLVNDRQFHLIQEELPQEKQLAALKRDYYHSNPELPTPFKEILRRYPGQEEILERNDAKRKSTDTLPSRTLYFSENVLRNRFLDRRKPWILEQAGFRYVSGISSRVPKLIYRSPYEMTELCVVDESEDCGCSGVMIEFLLILAEKGARNLILFVPEECGPPVHSSIIATMSALVPFENVIAVWGEGAQGNGRHLTSATVYRFMES